MLALFPASKYFGANFIIINLQFVLKLFYNSFRDIIEKVDPFERTNFILLPIIVVTSGKLFQSIFYFWEVSQHLIETFFIELSHSAIVFGPHWCRASIAVKQSNFSKDWSSTEIPHKVFLLTEWSLHKDFALPLFQNIHVRWPLAFFDNILFRHELSSLNIIKNKIAHLRDSSEHRMLLYCIIEKVLCQKYLKAWWELHHQLAQLLSLINLIKVFAYVT